MLVGDLPDGTKLKIWSDGANSMIEVSGTGDSVAGIGELLAWLGAALRSSPYKAGIAYCSPTLNILMGKAPLTVTGASLIPDVLCEIGFMVHRVENHIEPPNGQCWHDMFRNPVIVKGYPIPGRATLHKGLEIPLNMMAGLVRTKCANPFNGNIFIKGFSSMLVPTSINKDTLTWHLLCNKDGRRISYQDHDLTLSPTFSISYLESARHFVGWCSEVKNYAGMDI